MGLFSGILNRLAPPGSDTRHVDVRARVGLFAGWVSVWANVALFIVKILLAVFTGSLSVVADAVHTISDSLTSIVLVAGFRMSRKPPDERHPYGHGRGESIAGLAIGVMLAMVAVEMLHRGVARLMDPQPMEAGWVVIAVLVGCVLAKEFLARLAIALGEHVGSQAIKADAAHHRSDALSTVLVIAAFIGVRYGVLWLDGLMTAGVAVLIGWSAFITLKETISPLLGERPPEEMQRELVAMAMGFPCVQGAHEIMVHRYGDGTHVISLHIETPAGDAIRLHEIGQALEEEIVKRYPGHAVVHIDPINRDHPRYAEVEAIVARGVGGEDCVSTYHDLRIIGGDKRFKVVFDIVPRSVICQNAVHGLRARVAARIREAFPEASVVMRVDAPYFEKPQDA